MINDAARGALSGAVGTTLMSEILAFARSAGLFSGQFPHQQIYEMAEQKVGLDDNIPDAVSEVSWITNHFIYGTVAGVVYSLLQRQLKQEKAFIPAGIVLGLSLWAIGFGGWAPLAGLYPSPGKDQKRRQGAEIAAHIVYGGVTATMHWMLGRMPQSTR